MNSLNSNNRKTVVLYFQVHQPRRLNKLSFFDFGKNISYFDDVTNEAILKQVAQRCYLPVTDMLTNLAATNPGIRLAFSISGMAIKQFNQFAPEVLAAFQKLHATGCVELLAETSHHSLASLQPNDEFIQQVNEHLDLLQKYFSTRPTIFRNTELIYSNAIGSRAAQLGFRGTITDDAPSVLNGRSSFQVFQHPYTHDFRLMLRNNQLSDDIGFRYMADGKPLEVDEYFARIGHVAEEQPVIVLGLDYETFGEHIRNDSGIVDFLRDLLITMDSDPSIELKFPSEVMTGNPAPEKLDVPEFISWADRGKDISAWLGNEMQKDAFTRLLEIEEKVKHTRNTAAIETWRNLQASDHLYYMSTKDADDGKVHAYFSPYESPYEAFINYINVLNDFVSTLDHLAPDQPNLDPVEYERRHVEMPDWAREKYAEHFDHNSITGR